MISKTAQQIQILVFAIESAQVVICGKIALISGKDLEVSDIPGSWNSHTYPPEFTHLAAPTIYNLPDLSH